MVLLNAKCLPRPMTRRSARLAHVVIHDQNKKIRYSQCIFLMQFIEFDNLALFSTLSAKVPM
jgi:hypothetical protein